jgi:SPP1 gp7 family putative phage head morphogenesis protein
MSINEEIRNNLIKYRRLLIKVENQIVQEAIGMLGVHTDKILDVIARTLRDNTVDSLKVKNELKKRLLPVLRKRSQDIDTYIQKLTDELVRTHNKLVFTVLEGETLNQYIKLNRVTFRQLKILLQRPMPVFAETFEEEFKAMVGRHYRRLNQLINQAYMDGMGYREMTRLVYRNFDKISKRDIENYLRTLVQNVSGIVEKEWINQNSELIKGIYWVATLDKRTCPQCAYMDGRRWNDMANAPATPLHYSCRCFTAPLLKSAESLGLPKRESNRGFRESMDGAIPGSPTYGDWFETIKEKDQKFLLGESRFKIYKSKGLKYEDLVNEEGFLTLKELSKYYGK